MPDSEGGVELDTKLSELVESYKDLVAREEANQEELREIREELRRKQEAVAQFQDKESAPESLTPYTNQSSPECPVCYEMMAPPQRIFQCSNGHLICGGCRPRLEGCPKCRKPICGRAMDTEQFVRSLHGQ